MPDERRAAPRKPVELPVDCRVPATSCPAVMANLSTDGCRLNTARPLAKGSTVLLTLIGQTETAGTVVWSRGRTAGVQFLVPLSAAIVDLLANSGSHDVDVVAA